MDVRRPLARRRPAAAILLLAALGAVTLGGCSTDASGPGWSMDPSDSAVATDDPSLRDVRLSHDALAPAIRALSAGRHDEAARGATRIAARAGSPLREAASYVAAVAHYRQGNWRETERMLDVAERAADDRVAARARATRGLLLAAQARHRDAAAAFESAMPGLAGADRARAAEMAGRSLRAAGDQRGADAWMRRAVVLAQESRSLESRRVGRGPGRTGDRDPRRSDGSIGYVIQIGAYRDRDRAHATVSQVRHRLARAGYDDLRVVPREAGGRMLYTVRFGQFATRDAAEAVLSRHGWQDWIASAG